jgi:hypothetical protein
MDDHLPLSPSPPLPLRPHAIRLREPWEHTPHERGVRHTRSFNCPTNLDPGQRVWLVIDAADLAGVALNGKPLGHFHGDSSARLEIAPLLQLRNEVVIEQLGENAALGDVRLEIE